MGKISGMGFRFSKVVWVVPTTSSRKPYSHSSTAKIFGEGIDVGYGSGALGIIDVGSGLKSGSIPLAGHPESFQLEQDGPRIFVNVPAANQIAIVDRIKKQVVSTWLLDGAHATFPMALDEANHRLFVGCRNPAKVLVYDTNTGRAVSTFSIVGDTDDLFYDTAHKHLYVTGGEGYLEVFAQESQDRYTRLQRTPTAPGARTSFFVPELSRLYIAVPHRGTQAAALQVFTTVP
jgi:hypothetical protein